MRPDWIAPRWIHYIPYNPYRWPKVHLNQNRYLISRALNIEIPKRNFCGGFPMVTSPRYAKSTVGILGMTWSTNGAYPISRFLSDPGVANWISGILMSSAALTILIDNIQVENESNIPLTWSEIRVGRDQVFSEPLGLRRRDTSFLFRLPHKRGPNGQIQFPSRILLVA